MGLSVPVLLVFPVAMAFAGANDLFTMKIPNRISVALVVAFALACAISGLSLTTILMSHVLVGAAALVAGIAMFALGWMGGGDAKLLAVVALWLGYDQIGPYLLDMSLLGGVLAVAILAFRTFVPSDKVVPLGWLMRLHAKGTGIPYGIAIAGAALFVYPKTQWFLGLMG